MTMAPMDRVARLFLDTSNAEDGLDRMARRINGIGTQAEAAARQGLTVLSNQMSDFIANTKTGQRIYQRIFDVGSGKTAGQGKIFDEITAAEVRMLDATDRAHYEFIKLSMDLERMARSGTISAQGLQALNTRIAIMRPIMNRTYPLLDRVSLGLQRMQNDMSKARMAAGALQATMSGMPEHSVETSQALTVLQSATQGVMFSMALLQGNLMGAAFGLIFLRFTILKVVAVFALLSAGIIAAMMALKGFISLMKAAATEGGRLEQVGQRLTNFFRSVTEGRRLVTLSRDIQIAFGSEAEAADKAVFALGRVNQANMSVARTMADVAAATESDIGEVSERFAEIFRVSADQREDVVKRFAKDFDIEVRNYRNNLELLSVLNERFAGSAAMMAETQVGMIGRLAGMWRAFKGAVGEVVTEFFKPMIELAMAFVTGLMQGFTAARDAAMASGQLSRSVSDFRGAVQRAMPYVASFGYFLGRVLVPAIIATARFIKVLIDTLINWWQKTKEIRDVLQGVWQWLKALWDKVDGIVGPILKWVAAIIAASLALNGLLKAGEFVIGMLDDLVKAILKVPTLIVKAAWSGIQELLDMLGRVHQKIKDINSETVRPNTGGGQYPIPLEPPPGTGTSLAETIGKNILQRLGMVLGAGLGGVIGGALASSGASPLVAAGVTTLVVAIALLLYTMFFKPEIAGMIGGAIIGAITAGFHYAAGGLINVAAWFVEQINQMLRGNWPDIGFSLADIISFDWLPKIRFSLDLITLDFGAWIRALKVVVDIDWKGVVDSIIKWAEGIWPGVKRHLDKWRQGTQEMFGFLTADSEGYYADAKARLSGAFGSWDSYTGMMGALHGLWDGLRTGIKTKWDEILKDIEEFVRQIPSKIAGIPGMFTEAFKGMGDLGIPNPFSFLPGMQFGGVVPGMRGQRVPVLAEAGERFLGSPTFNGGRNADPAWGGGTNITIVNHISDSVVTNDASINQLADRMMDRVSTKLGLAHRISRHRI